MTNISIDKVLHLNAITVWYLGMNYCCFLKSSCFVKEMFYISMSWPSKSLDYSQTIFCTTLTSSSSALPYSIRDELCGISSDVAGRIQVVERRQQGQCTLWYGLVWLWGCLPKLRIHFPSSLHHNYPSPIFHLALSPESHPFLANLSHPLMSPCSHTSGDHQHLLCSLHQDSTPKCQTHHSGAPFTINARCQYSGNKQPGTRNILVDWEQLGWGACTSGACCFSGALYTPPCTSWGILEIMR